MRFWLVAALLIVAFITGTVYLRTRPSAPSPVTASTESGTGCTTVRRDYSNHHSGVWVTLGATVERILPDSSGQYRHQRFIVRCSSGQTVLIVNDVSIGERVPVRIGGHVGVRGQYIWNPEGGLVHFTHHNDTGSEGGWILWRHHVFSLASRRWTSLRTKTWITE